MDLTKNNVFKEYEAKLIETSKEEIKKVKESINEDKETLNHVSAVSDVYTSKMFSIIGTFLGKKQ